MFQWSDSFGYHFDALSVIDVLLDVLCTDSMRLCRIFLTNMIAVKFVDCLRPFQGTEQSHAMKLKK